MKRTNPSFNPIPASNVDKRPLGKWAGNSYLFERDFPKREQWEPDCNLGLLVGDDYIVVDVDAKPPARKGNAKVYSDNIGTLDFAALIEANEPIPETLTQTTPSGGKHYFFSLTGKEDENRIKNWTACMNVGGKLIAVDVRKKGGYVMCPPSKKGVKRYRWDTDREYQMAMAPLPQWIMRNILDTMRKQPKHFEAQEFTCDPSLNEEVLEEDVALFKESDYWQDCFQLTSKPDGFGRYIVTATAPYRCSICEREHVNNSNHPFLVRQKGVLRFVCRPGKGFNRVIARDYLKMWEDFHPSYVKQLVEEMDVTNRAVSANLAKTLRDVLYPTTKPGKWLFFDKETGTWREEYRDVLLRPVFDDYVKHLKDLEKICSKLTTEKEDIWDLRMGVCKTLIYTLSMIQKKKDHVQALFELVRDSRKEDLFNKKKHLLHCANGVFDLDREEFREAEPCDYSTMSTKLNYMDYDKHPKEKRDIVEKFFDDFTLNDEDIKGFLLKVLASLLSGDNSDQQFYFLHGVGANAKSLLIKLLKLALGDYAGPIPSAQVTKASMNAQNATPSLMALLFKRAAFLTELEDRVLWTEFLKMLAGGDTTSGRQLHQEQRELDIWCKIVIAVNDLPEIRDKTHGFWRKVVMIPCKAKFCSNPDPNKPEEKLDVKGFDKQLLQCADTFLAWLVKIYITRYKTEGVSEHPQEIKHLVASYRESQDVPLMFVKNMVMVGEDNNVITVKTLDRAYGEFLKDKGVYKTPGLVRHLYEKMDEMFPPSNARRQIWHQGKNIKGWRGVYIRPDDEAVEEEGEVTGEAYEEVHKDILRAVWGAR